MNIKVTNVDPMFVKEIDMKAERISEKLGRNFSRNEYVKMLIQNDADVRLVKLKEDKYDESVSNLSETMKRQEEKLQEYIDSNNRLFHLISSGIEIYDEEDENL